jgi:hypothetical protein
VAVDDLAVHHFVGFREAVEGAPDSEVESSLPDVRDWWLVKGGRSGWWVHGSRWRVRIDYVDRACGAFVFDVSFATRDLLRMVTALKHPLKTYPQSNP